MQPRLEDIVGVRQEMLELLRQQMKALDSPQGLSDAQLMECYARQNRVQELREKLQAASNAKASADAGASPAPALLPNAALSNEQYFS